MSETFSPRNQLLDLRRLAAAGITREAENFHFSSSIFGTVSTGAKPPPGVRKFVVCPW